MDAQRWDAALPSLNTAIDAMILAMGRVGMAPAEAAFGSVCVILTVIRDSMINEEDYVDLGLVCADVCRALDRGMNERRVDEFSQSVLEATNQLATTVAEIQRMVLKRSGRNPVSRLFHAKNDKEMIVAWKSGLNMVLYVLDTELEINANVHFPDPQWSVVNFHTIVSELHHNVTNTQMSISDARRSVSTIHTTFSDFRHTIISDFRYNIMNNHATVSDTHHTMVKSLPLPGGGNRLIRTRPTISSTNGSGITFASGIPGESPPPPPRACFGRDELIEKIVGLAETLTPIALVGAGGIGKTSIALTVLHNDRIKQRFGDSRRFICCDQLPTSRTHFLSRLSKVIGAGFENPEDLASLRPFLSSREMILFLDGAESVLDLQGTNTQEIYAMVEELGRFSNICLCITSRISTVPPDYKRLDVPTLSMDAACRTFYRIYDSDEQSTPVNNLLEQLDFHPFSVTSLATVAHHNKWDTNRLAREWERQRTDMLYVQHNKSLAATIELSLASPTFRELGPDAHDLLGVIAFFPQGINENNLDWLLFPTAPHGRTTFDRRNVLDRFCVLSLTYRSNGFITMLAPLRDHFFPKDPKSSPLLHAIKEHYFGQLSVLNNPGEPDFEKAQRIASEDVNIRHLLDVFTSIDAHSSDVWDACQNFMEHLYWHKPQLVALGPKIEGLPDEHPCKPRCLFQLSRLFESVGNHGERKRLLTHTLKLWRQRGDGLQVAHMLRFLADANRLLGLHQEGIQRVEEALGIYERFGNIPGQARSLQYLAWLLYDDNQFGAAEKAASRTINLLSDEGEQFLVSECHRLLGNIYRSKGEAEKAINHLETALRIASSFNRHGERFWSHHSLAKLFFSENRFNDAYAQVECAKSHAINNPYLLGRSMELQAELWYKERRFEEAKSEALRAVSVYEEIGATEDVGCCRSILRDIEEKIKIPVTPGKRDFGVVVAPNDDINTTPYTHPTHSLANHQPRIWMNIPFLAVFVVIVATHYLRLFPKDPSSE